MNVIDAEALWRKSNIFDEYKFDKLIGKGTFSEIWKAKNAITKKIVAVKISKSGKYASEILVKEFIAYKKFDSATIVNPECFFYGKKGTFMVLPMYHNDLFSVIEEAERLDEYSLQKIAREIGAAIKLVHAQHFVHRDIKPENIFVTEDNTCVLGDFGCVEHEDNMTLTTLVGTSSYIAPEIILATLRPAEGMFGAGKPSDIYSFGQTLFIAATKKYVIQNTDNLKKLARIVSELDMSSIVDRLDRSDEFKSLITGMTDPHPIGRMTIQEVLDHPFVKRSFV
jgi:serine/threonine protein kinase